MKMSPRPQPSQPQPFRSQNPRGTRMSQVFQCESYHSATAEKLVTKPPSPQTQSTSVKTSLDDSTRSQQEGDKRIDMLIEQMAKLSQTVQNLSVMRRDQDSRDSSRESRSSRREQNPIQHQIAQHFPQDQQSVDNKPPRQDIPVTYLRSGNIRETPLNTGATHHPVTRLNVMDYPPHEPDTKSDFCFG